MLALAVLAAGVAKADRLRQREQFAAPGWVPSAAALDLDFQNGRYWQAGTPCRSPTTCLTVSRASTHYCSDAAGNWTSVGINQPCVTNQGLLVEESRTNYAVNNTNSGASTGTPGNPGTNWGLGSLSGIAINVVALPTVNGLPCIDLAFSGNATGNIFPGMAGTATTSVASGDSMTISAFLAVVSGSPSNVTGLFFQSTYGGGGNIASANLNTSLTGSLQRFSATNTAPATVTNIGNPFFNIGVAGAVNFTLRACGIQLEKSSANGGSGYASSPILTSSGPVTRPADVIVATQPPAFAKQVTMMAKVMPLAPTNYGVTQTPLQIDEGDHNGRADLDRNANNGFLGNGIAVSGVGQPTPAAVSNACTGIYCKWAFAFQNNDTAMAVNGSLTTNTGNAMFQPARVQFDDGLSQHQLNGYVARATIWPTQRLPNGLLQQLTQ